MTNPPRIPARWARLILLLVVSTTLGGRLAQAEPLPGAGPHGAFAKGRQKVSLRIGYGEGFGVVASSGEQAEEARTVAVMASFGQTISDVLGEGAWYRGAWEVLVEGEMTFAFEPQLGHGGGATANLRYNFLSHERVVPYLGIGVGVAGMDFDLEKAPDGFNFIVHAGAGVHWLLNERVALDGALRWHHFSNAQTRSQNSGIDTVLFLTGMTIFLP